MIASILLVSKNAPVNRGLKIKKWAAGPPFEDPNSRAYGFFFAEYSHFLARRKAQTVAAAHTARGRRRKRRLLRRQGGRLEVALAEGALHQGPGILVRDRSYDIPGSVRVTVGTRDQVQQFLDKLEQAW